MFRNAGPLSASLSSLSIGHEISRASLHSAPGLRSPESESPECVCERESETGDSPERERARASLHSAPGLLSAEGGGAQRPRPPSAGPQPYTLHPAPCTLHPAPCTLHPAPYTLHPTPYTHSAPGLRSAEGGGSRVQGDSSSSFPSFLLSIQVLEGPRRTQFKNAVFKCAPPPAIPGHLYIFIWIDR